MYGPSTVSNDSHIIMVLKFSKRISYEPTNCFSSQPVFLDHPLEVIIITQIYAETIYCHQLAYT